MRRRSRNYRGSRRNGVGVLIPVLAVLCIIAAGVLYFVNDTATYTKSGQGEVVEEKKPSKEAAQVAAEKPAEEISEEVPEVSVDAPEEEYARAYFIGISDVKNGELFDRKLLEIEALGNINTAVLEVKAEDGTLAFSTDHEFVKDKQLSGDDSALSEAISKASEKGLRVCLYVSCFKDNGAAHSNFENAVRQKDNGWIWRDATDMRWLSAYSEASQGYIIGIVKKLSAFSPDEIILSNVSFPVLGKTDMIDYGENPGEKKASLESFIKKAVASAGNVPVTALYDNYGTDYISLGGQNTEVFKENFKALYVNTATNDYALSFDDLVAALSDESYKLIPVGREFSSSASEFLIKK